MLKRICKSKTLDRWIAIMLIITLTFANIALLGTHLISYAFDENLENQGIGTGHNNVKFDAYFSDNGGHNTHSVTFDVNGTDSIIKLYIAVKNAGYLKEGYIEFKDEDKQKNTNFEIANDITNTSLIQSINTNTKTLSLNYIDAGTDAVFEIPLKLDMSDVMDISKLHKGNYVVLRGIYVDESGKETQIEKEIKINLNWTADAQISLEQELTKYVPYNYNGDSKILVQVKAKLQQNNGRLPVKESNLKVEVPSLNGHAPEEVTVFAKSLKATNGDKVELVRDNWSYDRENNIVNIHADGFRDNNSVWTGIGQDEYYITYKYSMDAYSESSVITSKMSAETVVYTCDGEKTITAETEGQVQLSERIGDIVNYNVETITKELSKGYMYANYNSENKTYETEYKNKVIVNVSNKDIVNQLVVNMPEEYLGNDDTYQAQNYTYYKNSIMSKSNVQKLLGEDGYVNILNENNEIIYTINKDTQDENGKYIINYVEKVGTIKLQTSKPVEDGILEIENTKAISPDLGYSKNQVKEFTKIKSVVSGLTQYEGENSFVTYENAEDEIALIETSTNATLDMSTKDLSSVVANENVEFRIALNDNNVNSDLYVDPVFQLNLPSYIEDIDIIGRDILFSDELQISNIEKLYTKNGIVLNIYVTGTQTKFSAEALDSGAIVSLYANIKVNSLTPNVQSEIKMLYTNSNAIAYKAEENGYGYDKVDVNFVCPEEMVTISSVLGSNIESAVSTTTKEETAKLDILDNAKTATMKLTIINKYSNACSNIEILGRVPFKGNKSITTGEDLQTTFDANMIGGVKNLSDVQNVIVYYSANGDATRDINDVNNEWTLDRNTLAQVKSYLIVLPEYTMEPGKTIEFEYNCQIPAGLEHNENAYGTYAVYFNSISNYISEKEVLAPKVGVSTGVGANIEVKTVREYNDATIENNAPVKEGQIVKYKTTVNNTGTVDAKGVVAVSDIQNGNIISHEGASLNGTTSTWSVGEIKAGESKTIEYTARVGDVIAEDSKITNTTAVTANNFDGTLQETMENAIEDAELSMIMTSIYDEGTNLPVGKKVTYTINVENITDHTIQNVVVTEKIPEGLKYKSSSIQCYDIAEEDWTNIEGGINYDEATRTLTLRAGNLSSGSSANISLEVETEMSGNTGKVDVTTKATATGDGISSYSTDPYTLYVLGPVISVSQSANIQNNSYIKEGNEITFTISVKNDGEGEANGISIKEILPAELKVKQAVVTKNGNSTKMSKDMSDKNEDENKNIYTANISLAKGETAIATITAEAKLLNSSFDEATVEVLSKVILRDTEEISSERLTYTIEKNRTVIDPTNPDKPSVNTYRITGKAWVDQNKDGGIDLSEKSLEGLKVMLIDATTGNIVKDIVNGTAKQTRTGTNGAYTFTNIPAGKYIVVFEYDTNAYELTQYNKAGIDTDKASKAISTNANIDGELKLVGITDTIEITNSSVANMNIGLIEKPIFDLSLQKQITKITVVNKSGTKTYDFGNTKFAKIDIPAKQFAGSKITLEYKITVKNEGQVAGYARKIIDYMPSNADFDISRNPNWYKGTDGNLYNESLSNTIINPGETKELTLTLTKTISSENTEMINNKAEIYETYNEQNLKDIDSAPGNKAQSEDDLDVADALITIKTGQVVLYITITLISIAILGGGIYLINKKVLRGGNK